MGTARWILWVVCAGTAAWGVVGECTFDGLIAAIGSEARTPLSPEKDISPLVVAFQGSSLCDAIIEATSEPDVQLANLSRDADALSPDLFRIDPNEKVHVFKSSIFSQSLGIREDSQERAFWEALEQPIDRGWYTVERSVFDQR